MILLACRLSHSLRRPHEDSNLPVLDFWLESLRSAMHADSFWGPDLWQQINKRAASLESGIHELIRQCFQVEHLAAELPPLGKACVAGRYPSRNLQRARTSPIITEKQLPADFQDTEVRKLMVGCWTTLLADARMPQRKPSTARRRPSLRKVNTAKL